MLTTIALLCFVSSVAVGLPSVAKAGNSDVKLDDDPPQFGYKIHNAFAFGDSYTANPGAGKEKDDPRSQRCHVYTQSWPAQLNATGRLRGFDEPPVVSNMACTGAVLDEIKHQSSKLLEGTPAEMVLLTGGGNDIGFSNILKICLYGASIMGGKQKCDKALDDAHQLINTAGFGERIGYVVSAFASKKPHANFYWLGYPRLFSEEPNDNCDTKCFKIPGPDFRCPDWRQLSVDNRKRFNSLVLDLNSVIKNAIAGGGQPPPGTYKVYYLDVDGRFPGHRFCSTGTGNPNDPDENTYFYPLSTKDVDFKEEDFDGFDTSICYDNDALENADVDTQFDCAVWRDNHGSGNSTQPPLPPGATPVEKISLANAKLRAFHPTIKGAGLYADRLADFYLN